VSTITTNRPARPRIPSPELLAIATANDVSPQYLHNVWTTPEGDTVIETTTGLRYRVVEPGNPDGAGHTGLTLEYHPKGYTLRCPNFTPRSVAGSAAGEPWTVEDLEWLACKLTPPGGGEMVEDGWHGFGSFLRGGNNDLPVRCYALWKHQAAGRMRGVTMAEAAQRSELCAALRREILASGWLADTEAARL
jgi:hypothetical protein